MELAIAPFVLGCFSIVVALIQRARKENKDDHGAVMDHLQLVSSEIRKDLRQVRYEIRDQRIELRDHVRTSHNASDNIRTSEQEAE
jgi:hypothetical protein